MVLSRASDFISTVQNCHNFADYTRVLSETLSPSRSGNFIFCCGVQVLFDVSLLLDGIVCVRQQVHGYWRFDLGEVVFNVLVTFGRSWVFLLDQRVLILTEAVSLFSIFFPGTYVGSTLKNRKPPFHSASFPLHVSLIAFIFDAVCRVSYWHHPYCKPRLHSDGRFLWTCQWRLGLHEKQISWSSWGAIDFFNIPQLWIWLSDVIRIHVVVQDFIFRSCFCTACPFCFELCIRHGQYAQK